MTAAYHKPTSVVGGCESPSQLACLLPHDGIMVFFWAGLVIFVTIFTLVLVSHHRQMATAFTDGRFDLPADPWAEGRDGFGVTPNGWFYCPQCAGKPCDRCKRRGLRPR
jgi:hypothetical protein